ncbi:hypothetical protein MGYG_04512 [Nannizzia gypsea CBS 118893]|uniref:Uncharacterized protein n=1 Tax=Arthroderma gypseum (strain ATCC MYA-4604 / CBS 118893) TaxID=535722 RepID=E4UTF9_ARTGP|nr:hypothetical protein MGYG_04512 [Nannizzia gypsea CBS 118893]EFR01504.1 hypothetical protein MGYG_04512 [Nannizzia gypsea CBS 118893]
MEPNRDSSDDLATELAGPVRILVQTFTHLIPGKGYYDKRNFMLNRMCQKHWNCDWEPRKHRWNCHGTDFAFDNRRCYFLIDYGEASDDTDVPILSYEWTGQSLESKPGLAQASKVQHILRKYYPFSGPPPKSQKEWTFCESVKSFLHQEMGFSNKELKHIQEHPEDAKWLQKNLEPRFWAEIEKQTKYMDETERLIAAGILKPPMGPMSKELDDHPPEGVPIPPSEAEKYQKLAQELGRPVGELNVPWREWKKFDEYNSNAVTQGREFMSWEEWERKIQKEE